MSKKSRIKRARQKKKQSRPSTEVKSSAQPTSKLGHISHRILIVSFHLLLLVVPLFFWFSTSELFEFNKMVLTYVLTIIISASWICKMIAARSFVIKRTPLDLPIMIFVTSQILATVFSMHSYTSLLGYYSRFHGGLLSVLSYTILYYAFVTNVKKRDLESLALTTFLSATIVSIYGALEHFGHSFSCIIATKGSNFGVDCWIQDVQRRVFASFGQPNWLAAYLIMLLPLGLTMTIFSKKRWQKIFYVAATIVMFAALLFTKSRSGILGLAIGIALFIGLVGWLLVRNKKLVQLVKRNSIYLGIFGVFVLTALFIFEAPFTPTINLNKITSNESSEVAQEEEPVVNRLETGGTDSGEIRKIVWEGALKVGQRYPIFGSGLETFAYSYYLDRPVKHNFVSEWDFLYNKAHNEFLNFFATTGIVGLTSYLLMLGWYSIYALLKLSKKIENQEQLFCRITTAALLAGIAALSVSNFFGFSTVVVTTLQFIFMGVTVIINTSTFSWPKFKSDLNLTQIILISLVGLMTILLLNANLNYWRADVAYSAGKDLLNAGQLDQSAIKLNQAIKLNKREASFYDQLASLYAASAVTLAQQEKWQEAQLLAQAAEESSDTVMRLNPHQLNFYKTRARTYITLSQLNPSYLETAAETMRQARELSPTDPKILYNLGLIELSLEENDQGFADLEAALELKPDYESARYQLALAYYEQGQTEKAKQHLDYILSNLSPNSQLAQDLMASVSAQLDDQ